METDEIIIIIVLALLFFTYAYPKINQETPQLNITEELFVVDDSSGGGGGGGGGGGTPAPQTEEIIINATFNP